MRVAVNRSLGHTPASVLEAIQDARGISYQQVLKYVGADEELVGFGRGGSEALSLILRSADRTSLFVRKIVSESLTVSAWDPDGRGVMTPPYRKAKLQVEYLGSLPDGIAGYFPVVYNAQERAAAMSTGEPAERSEIVYDLSYVPGLEVSTFIAEWQPPPAVVARIYMELLRLLRDKLHVHRVRPRTQRFVESQYLRKIEERLQLARRSAPQTFGSGLLDSDDIRINDTRMCNIGPLVELFRAVCAASDVLEAPRHCLTMGDANTENVKITKVDRLLEAVCDGSLEFTYDDIGLRLLDPRAIGAGTAGADTVDDYLYDMKFWHNSLGNYDVIHGEHYVLDVSYEEAVPVVNVEYFPRNPFRAPYRGLDRYFGWVASGCDGGASGSLENHDPYWLVRFLFLMGTHFCAMVPFHFVREANHEFTDDWRRQRRPVALYCEGIRWLNMAARMLVGELRGFAGQSCIALPTWDGRAFSGKDLPTCPVPIAPHAW